MRISEIIYPEEYIFSELSDDPSFDSITTDFSKVKSDSVLIIPNSQKIPKHISLKEIPLAAICDNQATLPIEIPTIRVNNPRLSMANAFYRYEKISLDGMKLIGVTGTNGKSSTATLIKFILSGCGYRVGFIGTGKIEIGEEEITESHYSMTTPDPDLLYKTLRRMKDGGCDAVVMEVSSHALALDKVTPLRFDYGIFTNLAPEHLDFHGNMEEYFLAKSRLFEISKCNIFNIDDEYARRAYKSCKCRKISAGIIWRGDVWSSNIENHGFDGIGYLYHGKGFSFKMNLKLAGIYNAYNSMLAATVCIDMGCKPCDVKRILNDIELIRGRYEIINDKISVIIDYAHTDSAFNSIMKELFSVKRGRNLTVVFGCGGNRDRGKRSKMAEIAERYANKIIVTQDNSRNEDPKDIISDIIRGFKRGNYEIIENRRDAIRAAILGAENGDAVAIIGKGPEKYNIDYNGYRDFDEREIINTALAERRAIK